MVWTILRQQQQRGAQFPDAGRPPKEAVEDRAAQDHEQAGATPPPGEAPASDVAHRDQDITPTAPEPDVPWDEVVQPERQQQQRDDLPLPEGK